MSTEVTTEKDQMGARVDKMTRALRALGAVLLLTSASSFLVHRWESGNDLIRFGFLLAHSFVILGAALFCGGKLGESRSARLFLWTNLAMVPAHFAVLGGLVYSQFALDAAPLELPKYAVWVAPNKLSVLLAAAGTLITVIPTSLISARVLAPKRARVVTLTYVGLCSLLIIPLRIADGIAPLVALGAAAALVAERRWFAKDYRTRTGEGRLVRSLMAVPLVLLVVRTAAFYDMSAVFVGLLVMVAGLCGWVLTHSHEQSRASTEAGEWLSALAGSVGLVYVLSGLDAFRIVGPLCVSAIAGLFFLASRFSRATRGSFEVAAALVALVSATIALVMTPTLLEGTVAIGIGALALAHSVLLGRMLLGSVAALVTMGGVASVFHLAVGFDHLANWGTLSGLGIAVVIVAAVLERHREAIVDRVMTRIREARAVADQPTSKDQRGPGEVSYSPSAPAAGV